MDNNNKEKMPAKWAKFVEGATGESSDDIMKKIKEREKANRESKWRQLLDRYAKEDKKNG